ncbi:MAG: sigma-70 family RNA polymerase sigma factor [Sedimentisphaerales bacterium]|nr:sigma-70 family RNA polymerase sigma factor [Sedimentisphaerales bacterium]MBN2841824.1 sigma-70 family RNA polymerase sigma factor [Sedimentisphaerales bacterium]
MEETDRQLVEATLKGDKNAYGKLYDKYARLVRAMCYDMTHDQAAAQDLAQEVFLRAYNLLERLEDPDKFGAWLTSIVKNIGREFRRGKFRDRHVYVGDDLPEQAVEDDAQPRMISEEIEQALGKLPEEQRLALHVYYLQGQDVKQACEILKVSRSALFRLLEKARKSMEKHLK